MNLVRLYNLRKIISTNSNFSDIFKIFDLIDSKILNLQRIECQPFKNWVFYMNSENECIFKFNKEVNCFYVRYTNFWSILRDHKLINDTDIKMFIRFLIEEKKFDTSMIFKREIMPFKIKNQVKRVEMLYKDVIKN